MTVVDDGVLFWRDVPAAYSVEKSDSSDALGIGEFTAYASVFGNRDSQGHIMGRNAFDDTLRDWSSKSKLIPLLWGHNTSDPDYIIGDVISATADDHGLLVHGRLDMESPTASKTYRLIKSGRVDQMSFSGQMTDYEIDKDDDGKPTLHLNGVSLREVSVVFAGANQQTQIMAVKSSLNSIAQNGIVRASSRNHDVLAGVVAKFNDIAHALSAIMAGEHVDVLDELTESPAPPRKTEAARGRSVDLVSKRLRIARLGDGHGEHRSTAGRPQ